MKRFLVALGLTLALAISHHGAALAGTHNTGSSKSSDNKIHVRGYYRKDGTYVAPHDRAASGGGHSTGTTIKSGRTVTSPGSKGCKDCQRDAQGKIKRSSAAREEFMRRTGYPHGRPGYIVDHIVPLECGGADDPSNMQWQTAAAAKAKDRTESNCRR